MFMGKHVREIWKLYPKSRVRVDVSQAGVSSYCIIVTLLDVHLEPILVYEHYGSGNLKRLKQEAVEQLARSLIASAG